MGVGRVGGGGGGGGSRRGGGGDADGAGLAPFMVANLQQGGGMRGFLDQRMGRMGSKKKHAKKHSKRRSKAKKHSMKK